MKTKFITLFSVLSLLLAGLVSANDALFSPQRDTPKAIAKVSEAQACVEPIDVIRRQHMEFIKHQRDETVHKGIRTTKHSLLECVNCHVTYDENQQPVSYKDERHFCSSCHQYAAVSIDCFQCHNSKPTESIVKPIPNHPDFISPIKFETAKAMAEESKAETTTGGTQE